MSILKRKSKEREEKIINVIETNAWTIISAEGISSMNILADTIEDAMEKFGEWARSTYKDYRPDDEFFKIREVRYMGKIMMIRSDAPQ